MTFNAAMNSAIRASVSEASSDAPAAPEGEAVKSPVEADGVEPTESAETAAPDAPDASTDEAPKEEPEKLAPKTSKAVIALAKQERELRAKENELRAAKSQVERETSELKTLRAEAEKFEAVRKNPKELLSWIASQGVSWDDIADVLNGVEAPKASKSEEALTKRLAEAEARLAELAEEPKKREQAARVKEATTVFSNLFGEGTKFPISAAMVSTDELIALGDYAAGQRQWKSYDELASAVDECIREGYVLRTVDGRKELVQDSRRASHARRLAVEAAASPEAPKTPLGGRQVTPATTLTNARAADVASAGKAETSSLSFRELIRAAGLASEAP